jgi:2-isopropylmalate synthase
VGFPSASETEYEILRELIEGGHIPDDVTIQVLVQAREHLIKRTFEAIDGAKNVIVHFIIPPPTAAQSCFQADMEGVKKIAIEGAKLIKALGDEAAAKTDCNIRYEYSPESFMGTEMDYAVDVCRGVMEVLGSSKEDKIILNLPTTWKAAPPTGLPTRLSIFAPNFPTEKPPL